MPCSAAGNYDEAIVTINWLSSSQPIPISLLLGDIYQEMDNLDKAIAQYLGWEQFEGLLPAHALGNLYLEARE